MIFDLDGTLLDTLADLGGAMNRVLAARGWPQHGLDRYRGFVGEGMKKLVERALPPTERDDDTVDAALGEMRAIYGDSWDVETRPYPGIPELLDALAERGVPIAVLSNKPHELTTVIVGALLRSWEFVAVRGARAPVPKKPDPTAALEIAGQIGLAPRSCVFVGDTAIDMQTARNASMLPVGVSWGFRPAELRAAGAEHLIDAPAALLELL